MNAAMRESLQKGVSKKIVAMFRNPYVGLVFRWFLGIIMIYAGWNKLFDMANLATAIERYRIIPSETVNLFAIILPPIEIIAGVGLILGVLLEGALTITTVLLAVFLIAIESAILRGLDIDCGCFGTSDAERVGIAVLIRDVFLFLTVIPIWMAGNQILSLDNYFHRVKTNEAVPAIAEGSNPNV